MLHIPHLDRDSDRDRTQAHTHTHTHTHLRRTLGAKATPAGPTNDPHSRQAALAMQPQALAVVDTPPHSAYQLPAHMPVIHPAPCVCVYICVSLNECVYVCVRARISKHRLLYINNLPRPARRTDAQMHGCPDAQQHM